MQIIFDCRFLTLMAVVGSLAGSLLCFFKVILSFSLDCDQFASYLRAVFCGDFRVSEEAPHDNSKLNMETENVPGHWAYVWT
jgi:hypothetical protein